MNDPGLDGQIGNQAKHVEHVKDDSSDNDQLEDGQAVLQPSSRWFVSTAFPLIAGTFGPMASAFNINALVDHWRISMPPGGTQAQGTPVADPRWLIAVNAVSLVFALVANLALLMNMARRVSFSVAQPVIIIGWYGASLILVGLVVAATYDLPLDAGDTGIKVFTQAYYYAIMAAGLYGIVATLMGITVYVTLSDHRPREFNLTISQRTLMLQTIVFLIYLEVGSIVYGHIEGWAFLDAVYWATTTLLTIGTGSDFAPQTHAGRSLLFFYALGGVLILGLVIGSIRSLVLERGKRKLGARMVEKQREQVVKQLHHRSKVRVGWSHSHELGEEHETEKARREEEFNLMRQVQHQASTTRKWTSLLISALAWLFLWLIGAVVFWQAEVAYQPELTYFGWIYFSYISLTTIGYGNIIPATAASKAFFVFWALLAIPTLTILISNMGDTIIKLLRDVTLFLGDVTFLLGDGTISHRLSQTTKQIKNEHRSGKKEDLPVEEPTGGAFLSTSNRDPERDAIQNRHEGTTGVAVDDLTHELERDELDEAQEARDRGDKLSEDSHLYLFILTKEIRKVLKDVIEDPSRKYSFGEWAWFLRLMGEDENDRTAHRKPPLDAHADHGPAGPSLAIQDDLASKDGGGANDADGNGSRDGDGDAGEGTSSRRAEAIRKKHEWSWIGARSPLMAEQDEPSWVLEHLSMTLERELKKQRDEHLKKLREKEGDEKKGADGSEMSQKGRNGKTQRQENGDEEADVPGGKQDTQRAKEEEKDGGRNGTVGENTKADVVSQAKEQGL